VSPLGRRRRRQGGISRKAPNPLVVAAITILLAVAITYYAFSGKQIPFTHHFTLHALVRNSVDITADSPVRIAGIDVGKVTGTSSEGTPTKVDFEMSSNGLPVHKDASIVIRDRLFLEGSYYVQLDPGSPSAPIAGDGFTIPVSNTSYPVQFYQLLSTFDLPVRQSLENALMTLNEGFSAPAGEQPTPENSGAGGFKSAVPQFTPTLKDIAWVSQALRGTAPGDVERLLASASDVTSTLQGSSSQLADLVTGLNRLSGALAATDGSLGQTISGLDQTLQVAPPTLGAVDRSLPPLVNLGVALDPSLKAAPPLVEALTKTVNQLGAIVALPERTRLLDALFNTFTGFPTTLRQLAKLFPITKGVTDCLRTHVTPILTQTVPDGSLSSGRPVWQDFAHMLSGLSGAAQNFDGNGYWIRLISSVGNNGISVGQLPLLGQTLGVTPGSSGIEGARPRWVGDLTSADFRPDVPCSSQPLPTLAAATASADVHHVGYAAPPTNAQLQKLHTLVSSRSSPSTGSRR
jgi:phospholipid/cholesterol/gamma-HCH transport system substrate-binding protein